MPIELTIDPDRRIVLGCGWGTVTDDDLLAGHRLLEANPHFDRSFDRICGLTAATHLEISDEALSRFAEQPLSAAKVRRAMVCLAPRVVSRVLDFVAQARAFNRDVALFPTRKEAFEWLGADAS